METDWVCQRAHLCSLLHLHPDWSQQQVADAVGCSKSMANKLKKYFAYVDPRSDSILFYRSRAHHPTRIAKEVVERILDLRLSPPEHLKRKPCPDAWLYYLPRDEAFGYRTISAALQHRKTTSRTELPQSPSCCRPSGFTHSSDALSHSRS